MVGTTKDIDQRKQAETALRESAVRLRALTEHTSAYIYELDHEGRITFANRTFAGLTRQQVEGTLLTDWFPPELKGRIAQSVARAFASPDVQHLEYVIADPGGRPRAYVATIAPMLQHGVSTSAVLTAVDITEQKSTEQAIRALNETLEARVRERTAELQRSTARAETASRAKSEFLSHMSHELRTPLNAILGFAQILELSNPSEKQRAWAQEIRRAGDHLLQLIEELFDLSRIEVGQLTLSIEPLALMPIVREAINIVQSAIDARGIRIHVEDCLQSAAARVDGMRLRQILVNYLSNAVKYNCDGGHILISCDPPQHNRVRLSVTDTGAGIAAEELPRLFQPFDRLGAKARGIEGTGIGLALSKQLAELMDATVGADSTVGKGSTFWIDLPLAVAPPSSALPHASAPMLPAAQSIRVLYVEDNLSNLEVVRTFLAPYPNVKLYTTADGAEGVAVARSHKPDLILLDIHMPQMDGFAVLRKLQAHPETRTIPVVALSADAMPSDVARGLAAGFVDYLAKPVSLQALLAVIAQFSVRSG